MGPTWAVFGPTWAQLGPNLGPTWPHVGRTCRVRRDATFFLPSGSHCGLFGRFFRLPAPLLDKAQHAKNIVKMQHLWSFVVKARLLQLRLHRSAGTLTTQSLTSNKTVALGPCCTTFGRLQADLAKLRSTSGQLGLTWGQHSDNYRQLGANLGATWPNSGPT